MGMGMEEGAGMRGRDGNGSERREWRWMFYPPPLAGGVKIRASEFLGGGGMPAIIAHSPPPATASRSHPPPQAAEGRNV